jgi:hypothetical protein
MKIHPCIDVLEKTGAQRMCWEQTTEGHFAQESLCQAGFNYKNNINTITLINVS